MTFRFQNAANDIGTATANVLVQRQGDLDLSGVVDVFDSVILASRIVGNVVAGIAPFLAFDQAADADGNGTIDVFDLVLNAGHIVGNVACLTP